MQPLLSLTILAGLGILAVQAQTVQPAPVLQIIRETTKEGMDAAHEKIETEWAAAARKANHPAHYIALETLSGPSELWFIERMSSFGAFEEWDKASNAEPYKTISSNLNARDGGVRSLSRTWWASYRPDLSYGMERFNPGKTRYVMAGVFHVKLGHAQDFVNGSKMLYDAMKKANVQYTTAAYDVVAGAPEGTFLLLSVMPSIKEMDQGMANDKAIMQAMGDNAAGFMKGEGDIFSSIEWTLLQVKPGMSYPVQQYIDADPDFWTPKAAAPAAKKTNP